MCTPSTLRYSSTHCNSKKSTFEAPNHEQLQIKVDIIIISMLSKSKDQKSNYREIWIKTISPKHHCNKFCKLVHTNFSTQ